MHCWLGSFYAEEDVLLMKILVTGGEGYIGSYLTRALLHDGHTVVTLDSCITSKALLDFSAYKGKLIRHQASVANPDAVGRALQGVDLIYHLAARHDWDAAPRHPLRILEANVMGTATVLTMARKVGVDRVIFASSYEVYGNVVGAQPNDPCVPVNMVGVSKLAAEAICRGFFQVGLDTVILRLYDVWGGYNPASMVTKFVTGDCAINYDGYQTRDFVYIDDVVKALRHAAYWDSNIYNIATSEEVTLNGLWAIINPGVEPKYAPDGVTGLSEIYRCCGNINFTPWKPEILISELDGESIKQRCLV